LRAHLLLALLTLSAAPLGCSSGEIEKARGDLRGCEERRASLQRQADACRTESERQKQRWEAIQAELAATVPANIQRAQQDIAQGLPDQVRIAVELRLDHYFAAVSREFRQLRERNQEMLQELKKARRDIAGARGEVERVASSTSNLEKAMDDAARKSAGEIQRLRQAQDETSAEVQKIIASVLEFDRSRVACKRCDDKLKLRDKPREEILKFHSSVVERLTSLQTAAGKGT
jgi:chromosome segregation ATPase